MLIQAVLIAIVIYIMARLISGKQSHALNAWKKLAVISLAFAMIVSVLIPDLTNIIAKSVGIGRGADLLLYIFFATFLTYVLIQYVRSQEQNDKVNRLSRRIALSEAETKYANELSSVSTSKPPKR